MPHNDNMSNETNASSGKYGNFRVIMDIVMGIVYIGLSGVVLYKKKFGVMDLSPGVVYAMTGMLVLYGSFRIYRGVVELRR